VLRTNCAARNFAYSNTLCDIRTRDNNLFNEKSMKLSDFLDRFYERNHVKELGERLHLDLRGSKSEMIHALMATDTSGIELVLFRGFTKYGIQDIAKKLKLKTTGTNEEIGLRIVELLDLPEGPAKRPHALKVDRGRLAKIEISKEYLLDRFFGRESLQEFCREMDLPVSDSKTDLLERLKRSKQLTLKATLKLLESDELAEIADLLSVETRFTRGGTIAAIIEELKKREGRSVATQSKGQKAEFARQPDSEDIGNLATVFEFLDMYNYKSYEVTSRAIEQELHTALSATFGKFNVGAQVSVTGGKIDLQVFDIGVEVKTPSNLADLRQMVAQLLEYKRTYGHKLILYLVNAGAKPKDVVTYSRQCSQHGIKVILRE